eukprot:6176432-Pleurochrysis_carterae.AAC.2
MLRRYSCLASLRQVGACDRSGEFHRNQSMLENAYLMMDVSKSAASSASEREILLAIAVHGPGLERVNSLSRAAVLTEVLWQPEVEVLSATVGNLSPLSRLRDGKQLGHALRTAAARGLMRPLCAMLARANGDVDVDAKTADGMTALMWAAEGGHDLAVIALAQAGAQVTQIAARICTQQSTVDFNMPA